MDRINYPRTYQEADRISAAKQILYKRLTRANLLLLAAGAVLSALATVAPPESRVLVGAGAGCVLIAIAFWLALGAGRPENEWFDSRAVAESLKTMTWRYITKANPYEASMSDAEAEARFLVEIDQVLEKKQKIKAQLEFPPGQTEITSVMRELRASAVDHRLALYIKDRIRDQRLWYGGRAKESRSAARRWYWTAFALQLIAFISGAATIAAGWSDFSGVLVTLAALVMTWQQVQQFTHLAHSYGIAAQDFAIIEEKANGVATEPQLATYVEQAELAASREHTLWVSRNAL
jgi:hypothetical protein